jgi:membrane protease YdiL (CAAX protease family)
MSWLAVIVVAIAASGLLIVGRWSRSRSTRFTNPELANQATYQIVTLALAFATLFVARLITGDPGGNVLQIGNLAAPALGLDYLGVSSSDTWVNVGLTFLVIMTVVTAVTMWFQLGRRSGVTWSDIARSLGWATAFSAVNAFNEEIIFRATLVESFPSTTPVWTLALLSAILFGLPHYFGKPGNIPGVILAGFMGWLLTYSVVQTGGIGWALIIHFAQDIVILTLALAVARRR